MLHPKLINPKSIVVIGGSDNIHSPGGRVLKNLIDHHFHGKLFVVNPKKEWIQNTRSYKIINDLPNVDLAIIAIPARLIPERVKILCEHKNTKGFIIFSSGFSEKDTKGSELEQEIVQLINNYGGSLLGPNNIGLINQNYTGVFTLPIPKLDIKGVDFISSSGATAVFIMEAAQGLGLTFNSVYTIGNSAQIGVEEILEYFDKTFHPKNSTKVKILYIESIKNPTKFLKHTSSLILKGCKIAAIKAGSSEAGNRAAFSHTGALTTSNEFIDALLKKAGIIRCNGRNELITVAAILKQKKSSGKNIAIITHAGGPAVMLTDTLSINGFKIPEIKGRDSEQLLSKLYEGSSVTNPIDFLATGNAEQLNTIIDYCENKFNNIDAMVVIFGSPGLTSVSEAYAVLDKKMNTCKKPIYAVLPSVVNAQDEITSFIKKENIAYNDEVLFAKALIKVYNNIKPELAKKITYNTSIESIKNIVKHVYHDYLSWTQCQSILKYAGIDVVNNYNIIKQSDLQALEKQLQYPVVQKVLGPIHKSDVGGVLVNVKNKEELHKNFKTLMKIKGAKSVLVQAMVQGLEIFIGAKREGNFPPIILCGLGGIYIEVLKDYSTAMVPISKKIAIAMIKNLKAYPILKGTRGQTGIDIEKFAEFICKISKLMESTPQITDLDINPLIANANEIVAVDVRIKIQDSANSLNR